MFAGVLAGGDRRDVDADEFADVPRQCRRRAAAGFLGDGEQWMTVDQQFLTAVDDRFQRRQQRRHTGLVVEVASADVAAFGELRQRVEGDEIADTDAQRIAIGAGGAVGIQAQFDVIPTDRHFIHRRVERMSRRHQRQYAATDYSVVGKQADATAFGEPARPASHRSQGQSAVVLDGAHGRANGVQVRGNGAIRAVLLALERGANGAAAGHFEGNAQLFKAFGDIAHDGVGEPGRAGNGEHFQQDFLQVGQIGFRVFDGHGNS